MNKKTIKTVFVAALLVVAMLLAACNTSEETLSQPESSAPAGEVTYTVTVKDAFGDPCTAGVAVQFLQNGERVAMQPCDENGVATKTLTAGDYEVSLAFSGGEEGYYYEKTTLSAEITSAAGSLRRLRSSP